MSKNTNLDGMSKEELLTLKEEINLRLKGASFWETIDAIQAIYDQEKRLTHKRERIARSCDRIKKLEELGFSLVVYQGRGFEKTAGFINYSIQKIDDKYYGFDVIEDQISNSYDFRQALSDEDLAAVLKIFGQEVQS
ncbi:hypothetical protein [Sulfurospirillum multivorans]|uniref:Uncharacterized protein n=2 Tax=Sulfurospirillum multivorans TaxID=66821 RepID=A0AA86ANS1_SULMK|nr:hypothetical protein [Sulfurospirillum multivorans]AHJ13142.1 hypothetical protein SMUL_1887 [Sulfurospirillum multivorans DSM 12446]QEH06630.1 hypothetical protein SMN_1865 [Sulfurospirillum multivorans]